MKEMERLRKAVDIARVELSRLATLGGTTSIGNVQARDALEKIDKTMAPPPPEMEEVEVVRWMCRHCEKVWPGDTIFEPCCGSPLVKLTGTLKRPKPQPVERTVSIGASFILDKSAPHFRQKVLAPWVDEIPTGVAGTLTFTWTEDPK